jgi:PAS domain S-box-containing protein
MRAAVLATAVLAGALIALAVGAVASLPAVMTGHGYLPMQTYVVAVVWLASVLALFALARKAQTTVLDLWLMVVMCVWVCDVGLSGLFNAARFDLGWYAGRVYGLIGASFVLIALLIQHGALQMRASLLAADAAARNERRAADRLLSAVMTQLPEAVFIADIGGRYVMANRYAQDIVGIPIERGDVLAEVQRRIAVFAADGRPLAHSEYPLSRALRGEQVSNVDVYYLHADGTRRLMLASASPIHGSDGKLIAGVATLVEIGPRRQMEVRMRSVIDNIVDGIIMIDARGSILSFNPAAERLFGYAATEVIGRNVRMLMPEPYRSTHDGILDHYLSAGEARVMSAAREVVGRRADGSTFPMDLAVGQFEVGDERYFTAIVRDITERRRLEDQLRDRVAELADADRQKNDFLAMLGHELRNPLAPMRNALQLMKLARTDARVVETAQQMMERQLQQLVRLVDDLLDVSRIIRGKIDLRMERVDLAQALKRAVETSQPAIDANGHMLEIDVPREPVYVMGDLIRLAQVISNLLTNAAKYTSRPGVIRVTLARERATAILAVRDEGEGIPPELLPRLFDLFVQGTHTIARSQGGLGIGLTLVRRLVEMHHGSVTAHSRGKGHGSIFRVVLPVEDALVETPAPKRERTAASSCCRVLVVDDNVDAALSTRSMLELSGHTVCVAHDGETGLRLAAEFQPDAIVLDIGLPGIDGYEVARRLRADAAFGATTIIAVTGYGQPEDRARTAAAGCDHHVVKPADPEVLNELLASRTADLQPGD